MGTEHVLVVDDEPDITMLCRLNLEGAGYRVTEANTGLDALRLAAADPPDAMVLDLSLPDVDGWEILDAVRSDPLLGGVPVVVLTARVDKHTEAAGFEAGATDYIVKPFKGTVLVDAVRGALDPALAASYAERRAVRLAEVRARTEDSLFRALLEAAPDAMVIVDGSGTITLVNAQTERLFGYGREELLGNSVDMLVPARLRGMHASRRHAYAMNPRVRPMGAGLDLAGLRKDGWEFPVEISLSPLETDAGVLYLAAVRDVTDRRRAERAMADAYAKERAASQRLRELDELKSDFVSTVSHELRTPLTSISGFADTLLVQWDRHTDEDRLFMVGRISVAGRRLAGMIEELLDFTRLERGQLHLSPEAQPLAPLVRAAVDELADAPSVDVDVDDSLWVLADGAALGRTLGNVLGNAAKFSPPGAAVALEAHRTGDTVVLCITDHGPGIPAEERERIFDRFYRVRATAGAKPGTGIGLAIARQFIEAQGGRIWVEAAPWGEGARFCVELPAADPFNGSRRGPLSEGSAPPPR